jgi:hypothetical protein
MYRSPIAFASVALLLGSAVVAAQEPPRGTRLSVTRITNQQHGGFGDQVRIVIRDSTLWRAIWTHITRTPDSAPAVDFGRDMVIVAALGGQRSGCCGIHVDSVVTGFVDVTAYVSSGRAGEGCIVTMGFTEPVEVVRVPRTRHPVLFAEKQVIGASCLLAPKP